MKKPIIDKGIFLAPSGYWWAWSNVMHDRVYSLHTKDRDKAQAQYDKTLAGLREYDRLMSMVKQR